MYNHIMTKRKKFTRLPIEVGYIFQNHRKNLSLKKNSRKFFLDDRVVKGLLDPDFLSEKTLTNIEKGYNLPNLITLNYLATCLEVDLIDLIKEIQPYLQKNNKKV